MLDLACQGQIVTIYTHRVCAFVGTLIYSLILMQLLQSHALRILSDVVERPNIVNRLEISSMYIMQDDSYL